MNIRTLRSDEIDVRVQSITDKNKVGAVLLLYKDARVDMNILDETFGIFGWQRGHEVINNNLFCTIELKDKETGEWVKKQDVGTESNTEKEKGQASDSFKRAGVNVGIGRELYTSPFIWVELSEDEYYVSGQSTKLKNNVKFTVASIAYNGNREISELVIFDNKGNKRFDMAKKIVPKADLKSEKTESKQETKADTKKTPTANEKRAKEIWRYWTKDKMMSDNDFKNMLQLEKDGGFISNTYSPKMSSNDLDYLEAQIVKDKKEELPF